MNKEEYYSHIVSNFNKRLFGLEHLFINNNSNKLIITFAAFNSDERYSCVNSHSQLSTYDHLFVKDSSSNFYIGKNRSNYESLFKYYMKRYKPENIILWGSSMGAYAALKLAFLEGCNAFINCPQIDYQISLEYSWPALQNKLVDLDDFENIATVPISNNKFYISYFYGNHLLDVANTAIFKTIVRQYPNVITKFKHYDSTQHTIFASFIDFKNFLMNLYEESYQKTN